jgi:hypothetical protein
MTRLIALGVVFSTVLLSGAAAGLWNGRWGESQTLQKAVARLEALPLPLGDNWDVSEATLSDREIAVAEIEGYASRQYIHRRTGASVSVLLLCGRSGPMSVHTPEICYAGAGFAGAGAPRTYDGSSGPRSQFQVRDFRKVNVANPALLRVFLSWGYEGGWAVPARPRFAFAGKPYLYKLYVTRQMARPDEPLKDDPAGALLEELLPQLQKALFPVPSS